MAWEQPAVEFDAVPVGRALNMAYWMRAEHMGSEQRTEFDEVLARTPADWEAVHEAEEAERVQRRREQLEELRLIGEVG